LQEEKVRDFFAPAVCKKKKIMVFLLPLFARRKKSKNPDLRRDFFTI
jgi:hypothetical protein